MIPNFLAFIGDTYEPPKEVKSRDNQSYAFFKGPDTPPLYSGVENIMASTPLTSSLNLCTFEGNFTFLKPSIFYSRS